MCEYITLRCLHEDGQTPLPRPTSVALSKPDEWLTEHLCTCHIKMKSKPAVSVRPSGHWVAAGERRCRHWSKDASAKVLQETGQLLQSTD
jgi:hypothetical protein